MLRIARTHARVCIDKDEGLVLKGVHPTAPGNYNPGRERAIAERTTQQSTEALIGPSPVIGDSDAAVHRGAEDDDIHLDYQDQPEGDSNMGPG
jgi:hypothetical protein